jgi:hypothetical protein
LRVGAFVLVHLVNPREKFWGLLEEKDSAGITVRGLSLDGFDEWLREISRGGPSSLFPATVFFPIHRVERIFADETAGEIVSYADRLRGLTGNDPRSYLVSEMPED